MSTPLHMRILFTAHAMVCYKFVGEENYIDLRRRAEETPQEREVRLTRRREREQVRRAALSTECR